MPRALNSRNFGSTSGSTLKVNYHNGSSAVTGYIVKQMGSNKFKVTTNGSTFYYVTLAQSTGAATTLTAGYCTIPVTPYGGGPTEYIMKITSKRVVTTAGNSYAWSYSMPADATQARPRANGDDTTPSAFTFTDVAANATVSTAYTSAPVTLAGLTGVAAITVSGTTGATYNINGGTFKTTEGTVKNGDIIRAKVTSSGSANTTVTSTVTVGGVSDTYSVTTAV